MSGRIEVRICRNLADRIGRIGNTPLKLELLARFTHAVNYRSEIGLVTVLADSRALQPYSMTVSGVDEFGGFWPEDPELVLCEAGIRDSSGKPLLGFARIGTVDLRMRNPQAPPPEFAEQILRFLAKRQNRGLRILPGEPEGDRMADFIRPRIEEFCRAFAYGTAEDAAEAARRMAGCGPGLTPSTDDFLSGYLAFLPKEEPYRTRVRRVTEAAASATNEISASLLLRGGEGLYSEDVLALERAFRTGDPDGIEAAIGKVAEFGSTSGCDFLTGAYYGILDADRTGGRESEETGSQEERVLRFRHADDHLQGGQERGRSAGSAGRYGYRPQL